MTEKTKDEASAIAVIMGHCPECNAERRAEIKCSHVNDWHDDEHHVYGTLKYRILECRGCETVYFQKSEMFSEDWDAKYDPQTGEEHIYLIERKEYWPSPGEKDQPAWSLKLREADEDLDSLYDEIYLALNNGMRTLAAIGIRTAFDRASELLGINPDLPFKQKLNELIKGSHIGSTEKDALDVLTDAGGAAAHRGWRPSKSEVEDLLSILEAFLLRSFVIPNQAKAVKKSVPPRKAPKKSKP